ncbi:unnamed protein product [Pleuronectes platessa]|uniref:Uncharacterized protein n=1 Tax=Pleuronectes platessa TaxID=8262 RepID=A0A9N7UXS9_PLEPL|nr:unnamed protein product [Pleuronectes platessa]
MFNQVHREEEEEEEKEEEEEEEGGEGQIKEYHQHHHHHHQQLYPTRCCRQLLPYLHMDPLLHPEGGRPFKGLAPGREQTYSAHRLSVRLSEVTCRWMFSGKARMKVKSSTEPRCPVLSSMKATPAPEAPAAPENEPPGGAENHLPPPCFPRVPDSGRRGGLPPSPSLTRLNLLIKINPTQGEARRRRQSRPPSLAATGRGSAPVHVLLCFAPRWLQPSAQPETRQRAASQSSEASRVAFPVSSDRLRPEEQKEQKELRDDRGSRLK